MLTVWFGPRAVWVDQGRATTVPTAVSEGEAVPAESVGPDGWGGAVDSAVNKAVGKGLSVGVKVDVIVTVAVGVAVDVATGVEVSDGSGDELAVGVDIPNPAPSCRAAYAMYASAARNGRSRRISSSFLMKSSLRPRGQSATARWAFMIIAISLISTVHLSSYPIQCRPGRLYSASLVRTDHVAETLASGTDHHT